MRLCILYIFMWFYFIILIDSIIVIVQYTNLRPIYRTYKLIHISQPNRKCLDKHSPNGL